MRLDEAFKIVLELAMDNQLDIYDADADVRKEARRHDRAIIKIAKLQDALRELK